MTTSLRFRSADDLYAKLPVRDVARVLESTTADAEKKREELRDLVGKRYHDLIDSADAIVGMNDTVADFERLLGKLDNDATKFLAASDASASSALSSGTSARGLATPLHPKPS